MKRCIEMENGDTLNFESYIIDDGCAYGWFDGQHHEPTEMSREEVIEFIKFLQDMLDK